MPPKRKRETRMDAAIDSMEQYGFPSKLVRQTVHHLLKVYGGSHGWVFIEDAAYSLLIETLLEKPQHQQQPPSASASAQPQPQPHVTFHFI
ncbi:hypothetical protein RIF29_21970 [Crotalaria pallida]|uniref:WIYLD domain-containing protein n=1 Tax=Crotalaria pallida TaxID=3830 RepID=A0AAN9F8G2_CROPI